MINGVAPYSLATSKTLHHALFDAVGAAAPPFVALRRGADGMAAPETAARAAARAAGLRYPLLLKARGRGATPSLTLAACRLPCSQGEFSHLNAQAAAAAVDPRAQVHMPEQLVE